MSRSGTRRLRKWIRRLAIAATAHLNRLGSRPLTLVPFERDRSLGLRPLGSLAFGFYVPRMAVAIGTSIAAAILARLILSRVGL